MEKSAVKKRGPAAMLALCPAAQGIALVSAGLILVFLALRHNTALGLSVYALLCLLWGVYYYGDDFIARSGLKMEEISSEELELVTLYFADRLVNYYAEAAAARFAAG